MNKSKKGERSEVQQAIQTNPMEEGKRARTDKASRAAKVPETKSGIPGAGLSMEVIQKQTEKRASKLEELKQTLARVSEQRECVRKSKKLSTLRGR